MRQPRKFFRIWSGRWESNPRPKLGKLLYCHCTTPARFFSFSIIHNCALASTDRAPTAYRKGSSHGRFVHPPRASATRDLTPDHRTDIASKVDLANQVDLVPAPLAQARY